MTANPVSTVIPYTMEELNSRIDRSIEDVKAGRTLTSAEVKSKLLEECEWLRKNGLDRLGLDMRREPKKLVKRIK